MKAMYNVRFFDLFNIAIFHVIMRSFVALCMYSVVLCTVQHFKDLKER